MSPTLTILCGIPRVGKSSWIKQNQKNAVVVCTDTIRQEMFGHTFHGQANKFVFGIAEGMATMILQQGIDVIIDATNMTEQLRSAWKFIAQKCNANVKVIWIYADKDMVKNFAICLDRNRLSKCGKLPELILFRMASAFQEPDSELEGGWFEVEEYHNQNIEDSKLNVRINLDKHDDMFDVLEKWRKIWDVADNNGEDF